MIRLEHFSCYYKIKEGYLAAVEDVTLEVPAGQFLVLMGPSGCGKTTLLRGILGLCTYTQGQVKLDGKDAEKYDLRENAVAYVSQEYVLYPHLSVYDNIAYPLRSGKYKQSEIDPMVRAMAKAVGLGKLLTRLPKQLSGGQQQRLAIARALVKNPKIVLYDEPFSNVDAALRVQLRKLVYDLSRQHGQTVIYVTHDEEEAGQLADRVAFMDQGKIAQVQSLSEEQAEPLVRKRKTLEFFPQRAASQDYTVQMLPHTRKQVFWDVMKLQKWKLLKLGLLLLLFSLPIHALALLEPMALAQLYAKNPAMTETEFALASIELQNGRALLNIPLLMLFSVGFAGACHVIRQFAWGEPVSLGHDLKKGIKQNWKQMLLLAGVAGAVQWLCIYCVGLSSVKGGGLASYMAYLPMAAGVLLGIPVAAYMTACIPVYTNRFGQNFRLGLVLFLKTPGRTLVTLVCIGAAFITFLLPNFYCNIVGRLLVSLLIPVILLIWVLFSYEKLDKDINPAFFPELVGRGMVNDSEM